MPTWNFSREGCARARASSRNIRRSAGTPQINALKTFITTNLTQRLLVLDSLGTLYKETSPGVLSTAGRRRREAESLLRSPPRISAASTWRSATALIGQDMPRQYDDFNFDRVSQIGPAEGPSVADSTTAGSITPGVHQCAVVFVTRQGFWTAPSPPVSWTSTGNKVNVTNIPTGPSNVVQRLLAFTGAGGANFYHVPATMMINDNTTTSLTVDFSDTILLSGMSMDYLFSQIELPEQLGVVDYAERLFWWGERANMDNWRNLTFDGGWDASGNGRPLGWQLDPSFGAGGSRRSERRGLGRCVSHHGRWRHRRARRDHAKCDRGRVRQSAAR